MINNQLIHEKYRGGKEIFRKILGLTVVFFDTSFLMQTFVILTESQMRIKITDFIILCVLIFLSTWWAMNLLIPNRHYSVRPLRNIISYGKLKRHLKTQQFMEVEKYNKYTLLESDLWLILRNGLSSYFIPKNMFVGTYIYHYTNRGTSYYSVVVVLMNGKIFNIKARGCDKKAKEVAGKIEHLLRKYSYRGSDIQHWFNINLKKLKENWKKIKEEEDIMDYIYRRHPLFKE